MDSCTYLNKSKAEYKWKIIDFGDFIRVDNSDADNFDLFSSWFSVHKEHKNRLRLKLSIGQCDLREVAHIYLCWESVNVPLIIKSTVYIVSNTNSKSLVRKRTIKPKENVAGLALAWNIDTKSLKSTKYLIKNNITIACELTVYDGPVNIQLVYQPKLCHDSIGERFEKLLGNQAYTDFTFIVGDSEFKAHKLILMTSSPVFQKMLENNMTEQRTNKCSIVDIRPKIFDIMLKYIYNDKIEINLNEEDAEALLLVANKYELEGLQEKAAELLQKEIKLENVISILLLAKRCNIENLMIYAYNFIDINKEEIFELYDVNYLKDHLDLENFLNSQK